MNCYGSLALTVASPAQSFVEPFTVPDVLKYLDLGEPSANDIDMAEGFITAARVEVERVFGQDLVVKQWDLRLNTIGYHTQAVELRTPLQSVELIEYRDSDGNVTALTEGTEYIVDTASGIVLPVYGTTWPSFTPYPSGAVLIRFTSGYPASHPFCLDEGQALRLAMKMLISFYFEERIPVVVGRGIPQELEFAVNSLARGTPRAR